MRNTTPIQIRFNDLDLAGHVNNAIYLVYFELGRMDMQRHFIPKDHDWMSTGFILARNEVDYRIPILLHDKVQVQTWCSRVGVKSFDLRAVAIGMDDGRIFAECRSVLVCFDYINQCSIPLPEEWRNTLARIMESDQP